MLKRTLHIGLLTAIAGLYSCGQNTRGTACTDTKAFFKQQTEKPAAQQTGIEKDLVFGNKREHTTNAKVKWEDELKPFTDIDLLKLSYNGRFTIDTAERSSSGYTIVYNCTDPKTDLQQVTVQYIDGNIGMVKALYTEQNSLYQSGTTLTYYTDSCFSITGTQEVKLGNAVTYSVSGRFIKS